jgi:dihydroorotase
LTKLELKQIIIKSNRKDPMSTILIQSALLINEGQSTVQDVLIKNGRIEKIASSIDYAGQCNIINAEGQWLLPGIIDDQVHFREPGLTHKADIASESAAGVAGGVTSFMEMPNTKPPAVTQELLAQKYEIARKTSYGNYSFFMGASNDNLEEVLRTDPQKVCGIKAFMGSSTGNMLVDDPLVLERLFSSSPMLIATHCEDEATVRQNEAHYKATLGNSATADIHPELRSVEACYLSSSFAVNLAKKTGARLHVLHISTADELNLFEIGGDRKTKRITSEVCVHHLSFNAGDYAALGNKIKCNPAIKAAHHQDALWKALLEDRLDIIATDHAPHTAEEKGLHYFDAPSGLPLLQHTLYLMLNHHFDGKISMEKIVDKMCHAPADLFHIVDRGYIREGYFADLVLLNPDHSWIVQSDNILYKCGWSPLEGKTMKGKITHTWVNGQLAYDGIKPIKTNVERLAFLRP